MQNRRWFAVVPLLLASLAACSFDDPGYQWVLDQSTGTPPADTTPITHSFSAIISDVTGDDAFLLQSNLESLDIYTIVLDGTNPAAGSLILIREMSGDMSGRIIFYATPDASGNLQGTYTINRVTGQVDIRFTYKDQKYRFQTNLTSVIQINRTLYINSTLIPLPADPCADDHVAPVISLAANTTRLWPPNHNMVKVASGISASDNSGTAPSLSVSVTSSEPDNGLGDGDTANDTQVVDNGNGLFDVWVRAERSGKGSGRVYTISATSTDACHNTATAQALVTVPKSNAK